MLHGLDANKHNDVCRRPSLKLVLLVSPPLRPDLHHLGDVVRGHAAPRLSPMRHGLVVRSVARGGRVELVVQRLRGNQKQS